MKNQGLLTSYRFTKGSSQQCLSAPIQTPPSPSPEVSEESVEIHEDRVDIREESVEIHIPPRLSPTPPTSLADSVNVENLPLDDDDMDWEDELHVDVIAGEDIRGWGELRDQLDKELKQGEKTSPVSQTRKLLVLRNFATLQLKGLGYMEASFKIAEQWMKGKGTYFARYVRKMARYYQTFERLPVEKRGGMRSSRSLLLDECIRNAAREWLTKEPAGSVTPQRFQIALNENILPDLSVSIKKPLSLRTARRWLIRLGWRLTTLRKGVYMDGHERPDVVEYRKSFLHRMAQFESRMAKYEFVANDQPLLRVSPQLNPGEKEVIPNFQDETCFTVNEYKSRAWCVLNCLFQSLPLEHSCEG